MSEWSSTGRERFWWTSIDNDDVVAERLHLVARWRASTWAAAVHRVQRPTGMGRDHTPGVTADGMNAASRSAAIQQRLKTRDDV